MRLTQRPFISKLTELISLKFDHLNIDSSKTCLWKPLWKKRVFQRHITNDERGDFKLFAKFKSDGYETPGAWFSNCLIRWPECHRLLISYSSLFFSYPFCIVKVHISFTTALCCSRYAWREEGTDTQPHQWFLQCTCILHGFKLILTLVWTLNSPSLFLFCIIHCHPTIREWPQNSKIFIISI